MKKRTVGKEKDKIEHAITIGMICLVIFLVTGSLEHFLFRKSAKEIGNNYEVIEATVCKKIIRQPSKGSTKYYVRGKTTDGHEEFYYVKKKLYDAIKIGDKFAVYKYKDCYGATIKGIISVNAGILYHIFQVSALLSGTIAVIFSTIGMVQKIKKCCIRKRYDHKQDRYRK